ncbi:MAG: hypothetical protein C0599_10795 [Salinivirgaceae bacterium]|nr:MAG: hypothetical protein C0599_10795 [Salinivirgaceae bacterium]
MKENPQSKPKQFPKGHFVNKWMAIGMGIFTVAFFPVLIALDKVNLIALLPAFGMSIGISVGLAIEKKQERLGNIRPLNESEKRKKRIGVFVGTAILIVGIITFVLVYYKYN